mmetsp:Transcript_1695/g.3837  ORF Transcript_1695/g.3837 Transcript_1695/m.3837 type:complete len:372 (+) Transcript_1695:291-1406(+)|eukprot:CAMPEP_0177693840 /NCGR_PEP_ID=MMETSP0484_2-20121128/2612_1 /TAXON_ID=354590 /ORGANISM="Rhodomonas lens, Strain RHODO" /LENGTH=371 /DNA_ID=CAMNT_0019204673 /DNA_START=278 /DNA_END=1393 /DNA_ORIENTATION=+
MMKKNGERKKESVAYHLLPQSEDAPRIYHLKLSEEVAQALLANPGAAVVRLGLGKSDNALKIGDSTWALQAKPGSGNGSTNNVMDCVIAKGEYYLALGKVSQKLTVPVKGLDQKAVITFKKKTDEVEKEKKSSRAAINQEATKPVGKQKRKGGSAETIGESEKKRSKEKQREEKLAVRLSEDELKSRIIHWLALRDMDKNELKRKCEVNEFPQGLCNRVATWDFQQQLYRLLPSAVKELDVEACQLYNEDERRLVRARVKLVSPSVVAVASEEEAAMQRERYKEKHQEYLALDKRLREYQDQFELLGKQLASYKDAKQEHRTKKEIQTKFSGIKTELMVAHTDFMRLHDELSAIKDGLQAYHNNGRSHNHP